MVIERNYDFKAKTSHNDDIQGFHEMLSVLMEECDSSTQAFQVFMEEALEGKEPEYFKSCFTEMTGKPATLENMSELDSKQMEEILDRLYDLYPFDTDLKLRHFQDFNNLKTIYQAIEEIEKAGHENPEIITAEYIGECDLADEVYEQLFELKDKLEELLAGYMA